MNSATTHVIPERDASTVLYAHRGSMVLAPENTMPAFELALKLGADVLEIDVRLSKDKQVIVIHDERVDRTCNGQGRVLDMTLVALKKLDAAYHFKDLEGRAYRQQSIGLISLAELFEQLPDTRINIDIKDNTEEAAKAVAQVIDKAARFTSVNVGSFHSAALNCYREVQPQVTTAASRAEVARLYFTRGLYRNLPFQYLQIPTRYSGIALATRSFIQHATQRNVSTVFWTINELAHMEHLISLNVSGFVTDRMDIAGQLLRRSSELGTTD